MNNKNELTEKLKLVETEVYNAGIDLDGIRAKLKSSRDYEDSLNERLVSAKKSTEALQLEFFKKSGEISEMFVDMKNILDVFTGNFYNQ